MVGALVLVGLAVGAAGAAPRRAAGATNVGDARIVHFPAHVEVYEIVAGGAPVLKQDWTEAAREHVRQAVAGEFAERGAVLVPYQEPEASERRLQHVQVVKVHGLVSQAILRHSYGGAMQQLPSKAGRFDWTVGPGASALRDDHGNADYALFVSFVQGHTSGGRAAMNVAAAVLGGPIVTGRQTGIASLMDLRTGDIVWFHQNVESGADLRTAPEALQAVRRLLREFPF